MATTNVRDIELGVNTALIKNWTEDIQRRADYNNLTSVEEQLWKNASIYQVPAFARDLNPKVFTPVMVSFGPYHHGQRGLEPLEVHKERALVRFVKKSKKPFQEIVSAVNGVLPALLDSYYRLDNKWRSDRDGFLKLMIADGCFMLEVLHFAADNGTGYSATDPFFSQHGIHHKMPYIRRDMLLIENQLPLLLLRTLISAADHTQIHEDIDSHVLKSVLKFVTSFGNMPDIDSYVLKFVTGDDRLVPTRSLPHHALDLFRRSLLRPPLPVTMQTNTKQPVQPTKLETSGAPGIIRCAVELSEAGVKFKKSSTKSLKDIRFTNGILYLPELKVDDATECTLLNIVAFEHLHVNIDHAVTSYVCFMDEIIDSPRDVSLLHARNIIQNLLGSDKAVAELFNRISKEATVDPESSLMEVRKKVHVYSTKKGNQWRATLCHTYFRNPWSSLSLAGALLVIGLTIWQTVYSTLQFYHSPTS